MSTFGGGARRGAAASCVDKGVGAGGAAARGGSNQIVWTVPSHRTESLCGRWLLGKADRGSTGLDGALSRTGFPLLNRLPLLDVRHVTVRWPDRGQRWRLPSWR